MKVIIGYRDQDGKLAPLDEEQLIVSEVREMRAQGRTFRDIAGNLNDRGIVGKRGGRYHASTIRAICTNSLHMAA